MKEENYYNITFTSTNRAKITCHILADSSIKNMIQILKNKTSIDLEDYSFLYNAEKIDINSQLKIKELLKENIHPNIIAIYFDRSLKYILISLQE